MGHVKEGAPGPATVKKLPKFRFTVYLLGLAGAALFTILIVHQGVHEVARAVATAGWWMAVIAAYHLFPLFLDAFEWWILFPPQNRLRIRTMYWARWLGESFSNLVPAAQVGGDILRTRLVVLRGASIPVATAAVLVDITVSVFIQTLFTLLGLSLLVLVTGQTRLLGPSLAGAPIAMAAVAGFYFVQRFGLVRLFGAIASRCANDPKWRSLLGKGGKVDQTLRKVYGRTGAVAACCVVTMISFVVGSGEVWIGLHALGVPAGFEKALILESFGQGVQSALCFIPGALGVREGGYLVIGRMLGIPGDIALALALMRRVREIAIGVPGLIAWQLIEGQRLLQAGSTKATRNYPNLAGSASDE
jgi:putative membrane protein